MTVVGPSWQSIWLTFAQEDCLCKKSKSFVNKKVESFMPEFIKNSLRAKLTLIFALLAIVCCCTLGALVLGFSTKSLDKEIHDKLLLFAKSRQKQIINYIAARFDDVTVRAHEKEIGEIFRQLLNHHTNTSMTNFGNFDIKSQSYQKVVASFNDQLPFVGEATEYGNAFFVCAAHGHVMYSRFSHYLSGENLSSGIYGESPLAKVWTKTLTSKRPVISNITRVPGSDRLEMYAGIQIHDEENKAVGSLIFTLHPQKLEEMVRAESGLGETGECYMIGDDGVFLTSSKFLGKDVILNSKVHEDIHRKLLAGEAGTTTGLDYRNIKVLSGFCKIPMNEKFRAGFDWYLLAEQDYAEAMLPIDSMLYAALLATLALLFIAFIVSYFLGVRITHPILVISSITQDIAKGILDNDIPDIGSDEIGILSSSIDKMQSSLSQSKHKVESQDWLKTGVFNLNKIIMGDKSLEDMANLVLEEICRYLNAHLGAMFVVDQKKDSELILISTYAYTRRKSLYSRIKNYEGLVGQSAKEKKQIVLTNLPDDYVKVSSSLGETLPKFICVTPMVFKSALKGVLEIGSLRDFTDLELEYLNQALAQVAIAIETGQNRLALNEALIKAQELSESLQVQQEELKASNEELEEQTKALRTSELQLKQQQEELQAANEELEEQTQALKATEEKLREQQEELQVTNEELEENNSLLQTQKQEVEAARAAVEKQAADLAVASKYKSEFLANMSHELRTPLNSLLILARSLQDNRTGNLTEDQVESAQIIFQSGNDLLTLINEILDLSKIEAGKLDLILSEVQVKDLAANIKGQFQHIAEEKNLEYSVLVDDKAPKKIVTDEKRLLQILKNLLSNAIKFTDKGKVEVFFNTIDYRSNKKGIAIKVKDTGIGIESDHQKIIFEAFQQAEGGISRKYGGTGLGLSISRELASLLGGEIILESISGKGSEFTLVLPLDMSQENPQAHVLPTAETEIEKEIVGQKIENAKKAGKFIDAPEPLPDDREILQQDSQSILIIEDDLTFAKVLMGKVRERNLLALHATTGLGGIDTANSYMPVAVVLDLRLPDVSGEEVLESLKHNPKTRHIPVHIISGDDPNNEMFKQGAIGFLQKPLSEDAIQKALQKLIDVGKQEKKRLLIVEDNEAARKSIRKLLEDDNTDVFEAGSSAQALKLMKKNSFHCIVLDLGLDELDGYQLLQKAAAIDGMEIPPVIVYTGRELSQEEEMKLRGVSDAIIIKGVRSEERLLDEVSLFLHQVVNKMPPQKRKIISNLYGSDEMFKGKRILIVDDDMRTLYALSRLLSDRGIVTEKAENGEKALEVLKERTDQFDLVLMDIMMPVMDGFDTISAIRKQKQFAKLPIIALTAKAMKGDREKVLGVGASDYLPKPVDQDRLFSLLRIWLFK